MSKNSKKIYKFVGDEERRKLISLVVYRGKTIAEASAITGVNYENAKAIVRVYRTHGRDHKKKVYDTKSKMSNADDRVFNNSQPVKIFRATKTN